MADAYRATEAVEEIKAVPQEAQTREAIRREAAVHAALLDATGPPSLETLRAAGERVLQRLALPASFLGFAMVAVDNAFWAPAFRAVPPHRRLLLLPKCLSAANTCRGHYDAVGLHCAACGACTIPSLQHHATSLGYRVLVAEGTTSVIMQVLEGRADAVLGVACLDSLEKSFERISGLGIPHQAVPLLCNGCRDTRAETELIHSLIADSGPQVRAAPRTYLPLLRETQALFQPPALATMLADVARLSHGAARFQEHFAHTAQIAHAWLAGGGKRLRPFITLAAYAVGRHGASALVPDAPVHDMAPPPVRRLAIAIEALHKASLVHDDIEDDDPCRYGQPTLHRVYGVPAAINIGDYLVGLGYQLVASQAAELGAACVADILARLAHAHLQLCCGQGAELVSGAQPSAELRPIHALQIGALKTAPAFEVALYAGLRAAQVTIGDHPLHQYATLVGEGYQVLNDLTDWEETEGNKVARGLDALAQRPTVLRAFAAEAGAEAELAAILQRKQAGDLSDQQAVNRVRDLYQEHGVFHRAEQLYQGLRSRALTLASQVAHPALQQLLGFLVRTVLPQRRW